MEDLSQSLHTVNPFMVHVLFHTTHPADVSYVITLCPTPNPTPENVSYVITLCPTPNPTHVVSIA